MTNKQFRKLLDRDGGCLHCGETVAVSPNHRINRGMGGSKVRDVPSNLIVLCSVLNGLIESDSRYARVAKEYGWKLESWQNPREVKVFSTILGKWLLLDDEFGYSEVS